MGDFVRGAEECLEEEADLILTQPERKLLAGEPEAVIAAVTDALDEDEEWSKEIASKLAIAMPGAVEEAKDLLEAGEKLEDRSDVIGRIVTRLLSGEENTFFLGDIHYVLQELVDELVGVHDEDGDDDEEDDGDDEEDDGDDDEYGAGGEF